MGRSPCCSSTGLNRGSWTASEDKILSDYIKLHGEGKWRQLPLKAGLKRCGKSCRLRWLNYLKPGIKRGNISHDEEDLIIRLHKLLGNRWSLIAGRLPGRTDNEIKNYWNTTLAKKLHESTSSQEEKRTRRKDEECVNESNAVRTKAVRCSRTHFSPHPPPSTNVVELIQDPSNRTEPAEAALFALYHENNNGNDESSMGLAVNGYIGGGGPVSGLLNLDFTDSFNLDDEMVKGDDMMSGSSSGTDATHSHGQILEYLTSIGGQWIMD